MQQLIQQNNRLRQIMQKCQQQILQLRKIGQQHEQQIDNLLKFNQRLLSIIQTQMPNKTISRSPSGGNLQPIDEAAGEKEQQLGVGNNNNNGNNSSNLMGLVNNHRFVSMQLEKQHAIKERVEHLEKQQVEHLSQQQNNYTHHHQYNNNNKQYNNNYNYQNQHQQQQNHINNINNINSIAINHNQKKQLKFINTQSYSPRTNNQQQQQQNRYNNYQQQQQYDQYQEERDNVIYRQEKQSLIDIPKFFKLQKGLNQHYHKELFHSIEEHNNNINSNKNYLNVMNNNNLNNNINTNNINSKPPQLRKLSIPSQTSQLMGKISQAQTQRITQIMNEQQLTKQLNQIKSLIHQYRDDFNLQQCLHLCDIIKQDLENDLVEIKEGNQQRVKNIESKERQCRGLKQKIRGFSGMDNLVEIMKRLNVSRSTQYLVMQRISGISNSNGSNIKNSQNSQNSNNINSMSNVSIMARNR